MSLNVQLGTTSSDKREVSKSFTVLYSVSCNVYETSSVFTPSLRVAYRTDLVNCTYAYVPDWSRYYFVTDIQVDAGSQMLIHLKCDVLYTYSSAIRALYCNINRNRALRQYWLQDEKIPLRCDTAVSNYYFDESPFSFDTSDPHYILTALGGYQKS